MILTTLFLLYITIYNYQKWSIYIEREAGYDRVAGVSVMVSGAACVYGLAFFSLYLHAAFSCGVVEHCQVEYRRVFGKHVFQP